MSFRWYLSCLCLLTAPLQAEPFGAGEVRLRLSAVPNAALLQRSKDQASRLCAGDGRPELLARKNSAFCRAKVINTALESQAQRLLQLGLVSLQPLDDREDGTLRLSFFARALAFGDPQPLETSCGRWTWSLRLDPRATQPVSEATLRPASPGASRGTFSGELQMAAQIRFESASPARRVVVLPLPLRLDLTGSWAAEALAGDPAVTDLVLSQTPGGIKK
jgi:hypothetical protein